MILEITVKHGPLLNITIGDPNASEKTKPNRAGVERCFKRRVRHQDSQQSSSLLG